MRDFCFVPFLRWMKLRSIKGTGFTGLFAIKPELENKPQPQWSKSAHPWIADFLNYWYHDVLPLISSEKRLHSMNQLVNHPTSVEYFWPDVPVGHIQDDHLPFLNRGDTLNTTNVISIVYIVQLCWVMTFLCLSCQVCASSTSSRRPSRLCGTRLTTTSRTWIAPPFRTSTRSCRFLSWSTSTPDQPSLQPNRTPRKKTSANRSTTLWCFTVK